MPQNFTDSARQAYLEWLLYEDSARRSRYRQYREYYDGEHDTQLSERMSDFLQVKTGQQFNENYCPIVVDAKAERLSVTGFTCDYEDIAGLCWDWWQSNRMDARQNIVHTAAVRDGDTYVLVEWDNENDEPRFTFEPAYDGVEGVDVRYDPNHSVLYAAKRWQIGAEDIENTGYRSRLNLYYPDHIEKYVSDSRDGANWEHYTEDGDWTIPWVDGNGEPLGMPVIPFRNNAQGYDYGQSDLANAIPIQNALNKSVIDLLAAADTSAFRIYVATGDDWSDFQVTPGVLMSSQKPDAKVSAIDGGSLAPLINLKDSFVMDLARVTRTPAHYFQNSRQRAAEGTLKQEEAGLISRIENAQVTFGNSWEDVMTMGLRLASVYGQQTVPDDMILSTQWTPAAIRDEDREIEIAKAKRGLGIPQEQLWAELGYSPGEIEDMKGSDEYRSRQAMMQMNMGEEMNG